jgi:hypothetical protein
MRAPTAILFLAADVQSLLLPTTRSVRTVGTPRMGLLPEGSLGGKMLKTVTDLFDNGEEAEASPASESEGDTPKGSRLLSDDAISGRNSALEDAVSDIDSRAAEGDITFRDFLTMSKTISGMGEDMSALPPGLSATQILELRAKVTKHEKIVEVMMEDEKDDPELLMEDLKSGGSKPGPRMQRLATASGETEQEVGLFLMQFEAMRESTRRIADGEDPDAVNESLSAPPGANRQARRVADKKKAKAAKKKNKM